MVYGDFKDLPGITTSDEVLCHKVFNIAKNDKYDGYQRTLASIVYKSISKSLLLHIQMNLVLTEEKELILENKN